MARNKIKERKPKRNRREMILEFAYRLHLPSIEAYQQWCEQQGFSTRLNKTQQELEHEYKQYICNAALIALKRQKRENNLQFYIKKLYSNEIHCVGLNNEILHIIGDGFKKTPNRQLLRDVMCDLDEKSKLLTHGDYVKGIISFVTYYRKWIRPITDWQPKTRNVNRQFSSLARHLFAEYPVPAFMDTVWQQDCEKAKGWFIHIGMGDNIRSATHLPIKLTKKMAHNFIKAPNQYDVNAAFRWAQIQALGGNKTTCDAIIATRIGHQFTDEDFWLSVLRFFISNPMLDTRHYGPIIDYIWNQKYELQMTFIDRGIALELPPQQPNFTMKGRTPNALLQQVDSWHRRLGKEQRVGNKQWVKSKFSDFRYVEGKADKQNMKVWKIYELLSSKELVAEGRAQQHCVATYVSSCHNGHTSIWTMDFQNNIECKKLLTIEVHIRSKSIRQIRGLRNRLATQEEKSVLRRWADSEGLVMQNYV